MGISFKEAISNGLITPSLIDTLPKKCRCGAELEFNNSFKQLVCTSENCKYKLMNRMQQFAEYNNITISDTNILRLIDKLNIITPYQLLVIDEVHDKGIINITDIPNIDDIVQSIKILKSKEYLVYQIVEMCGVAEVMNVAQSLFSGFSNLDDAFNEIESGQITFINEHLGINSTDSSILSVEIYNKLISLKEEMMFGETQLKVIDIEDKLIRVAVSDNIKPYVNIKELLEFLNSTYDYEFKLDTIITNKTDILIKNSNEFTNKYRVAKMLNDRSIAKAISDGNISLGKLGTFKENEIKPIGYTIYVDTLENIIGRLNNISRSD